jgi:hypothetical protein
MVLGAVGANIWPGCGWDEPELAENSPPVINAILVDGQEVDEPAVREGQKVVFKAVVWDPNGDGIRSEGFAWSANLGELDGTSGSSVVWEAPSVVWESPPQQVTVEVDLTVADGRGGEDSTTVTVHVIPPCDPSNQPPVVTDVTASPNSVNLGESVKVTALAEDPEGGGLTYEWIVPFGYYEGSGSQIEWFTTDTCCRDFYPVQVFVNDGCDTTWSKVDVEVIP